MEQTKETILECLKSVIDPEVFMNIVDMGLVYDVIIEDQVVTVEMTLTTKGCPMREYMEESVGAAVSGLEGVKNVEVKIVWEPPWSPEKINREAINQQR